MLARFRGDDPWMPCGKLETEFDPSSVGLDALEAPHAPNGSSSEQHMSHWRQALNTVKETDSSSERRRINGQTSASTTNLSSIEKNGILRADEAVGVQTVATTQEPSVTISSRLAETLAQAEKKNGVLGNGTAHPVDSETDATMEDAETGPTRSKGEGPQQPDKQLDLTKIDADPAPDASNEGPIPNPLPNGSTAEPPTENAQSPPDEEASSTLPASHRMTTRAQAHAISKTPSPRSSTPTLVDEDAPIIHPFFLLPPTAAPDRDFGLPPQEADETRRLLLLYVQKQEEVVRGAQELCYGLLRADRMRKDVFRWTKAESHVGEMSDGEDWYDREEWGLEEDLVKGKEEEEDEVTATGKKTRQRRAER